MTCSQSASRANRPILSTLHVPLKCAANLVLSPRKNQSDDKASLVEGQRLRVITQSMLPTSIVAGVFVAVSQVACPLPSSFISATSKPGPSPKYRRFAALPLAAVRHASPTLYSGPRLAWRRKPLRCSVY